MKKRNIKKRLTLNISISIGCFVFILTLCSILSIVSYNIGSNILYSRYKAQMKSIVDVAQSYIDDDDMSECATTFVESEKYKETKEFFDNFVTHYTDLHYLYVVKVGINENGNEIIYAICSASTEDEKINDPEGCLYLGDGEEGWYEDDVVQKFKEITIGNEDVYFFEDSDWGKDYTLARPLVDSKDNHYAVLCVDVAVETINISIRRIVLSSVGLIVGIGIIFSLLLILWMYLSIIKPIRSLQTSVSDFAESSHDILNPEELVYNAPRIGGGKEINNLSLSVEKMSYDMRDYAVNILEREKEVRNLQASMEKMDIVAHHDALTGIKNKAAYDKKTDEINQRIESKEDIEFAVVMIDINGLKVVNDTFGHDYGDKYIIGAINIITNTFKNSSIYRVGGDEIVVLLFDDDYQNRKQLVAQIKNEFIKIANEKDIKQYERYSAAVGMSEYQKDVDVNINTVFKRADKAMYKNKVMIKSKSEQ